MRSSHGAARNQVTPARALAGAIVLLIAGLLASAYQDRVFGAQRIRELTVQGQILAASVTAALVFGDAATVQENVSALIINPAIDAAGVYDTSKNLVASFVREDREPLPRSSSSGSATAPEDYALVVLPVSFENDTIGTVHIRARKEPLLLRLTRHVPIMLLAVMAALLVAFMGTSQRTLREANHQLEGRALALAKTNELLQNEMEERSKAEEALRQSQKMEAVGQLSGGVAHDFNNLLTIISGSLHLMKESGPDDRVSRETYLHSANQAVERAGHLVRRLLAFSRRQPLSPRSVDMNELAIGMKPLILHSVGDRVLVDWKLNSKWRTFCDVNQMENVILNLAINARDAMPEGGTVTIETNDVFLTDGDQASVAGPGEYVEVRVVDTGLGMTEEVRRRAVDPFFTTKPHGQGTGLGLSMAFSFIRESNGHLRIETEVGLGTAIAILLPRHAADDSMRVNGKLA